MPVAKQRRATIHGYVEGLDPRAAQVFWQFVNKTESCWLWTGPSNGRYGRLGRRTYAHRLSWEIANGPIPPGLFVLHRCDTPRCVNPAHLFLGTPAENTRDAKAKGRLAVGARHGSKTHPESVPRGARHGTKTTPWRFARGSERPQAKLTEHDVRLIRQYADAGVKKAALSRRFGVSQTVIRKIAKRESWKHVL